MAHYNPENYAPVDDRIAEFYEDHPDGSIRTFMVVQEEKTVIFEARAFRNPEEAAMGVYTSGWAREVEGASPVNRTSHIENCETSAIGRALANLGYSGKVNGNRAPRPSREEMNKVQRQPSQDTPAPATQKKAEPWMTKMPIGRKKGTLLGDLSEKDLESAATWIVENNPEKFAQLRQDIEDTLERMRAP